jgi:hypothetical protein
VSESPQIFLSHLHLLSRVQGQEGMCFGSYKSPKNSVKFFRWINAARRGVRSMCVVSSLISVPKLLAVILSRTRIPHIQRRASEPVASLHAARLARRQHGWTSSGKCWWFCLSVASVIAKHPMHRTTSLKSREIL